MKIDIITLFPGMVEAPLAESIVGRARARGVVDIGVHNLRDFASGRHQVTDEPPFGGGGGMILKPEPLATAIDAVRSPTARVVLLSPAGRRFTQAVAGELARESHLVLVCGRYEGVDARIGDHLVDEELSIGDYVLSGGELAALVVAEAVTRLLPGALGDEAATEHDSFTRGLLEHPHYTRPEVFGGWRVPSVLLSGDHAKIGRWRRLASLWRTWQHRPDLLETADLSPEEQKWVDEFRQGREPSDLSE
ncbi:MAG TPA: tRNA (guanosine(37)-N1)-methyltransferase TrmD [Methylomirabilota bacterium]|nr:tRNA (guanosine(37)-N1)-methyltransferase TrmD [Methylomirabilota bacterium]